MNGVGNLHSIHFLSRVFVLFLYLCSYGKPDYGRDNNAWKWMNDGLVYSILAVFGFMHA